MAITARSSQPAQGNTAVQTAGSLIVAGSLNTDLSQLLAGARLPLALIDPGVTAIEAITRALETGKSSAGAPVQTLHLIGHGRPGALLINGEWITSEHLVGAAGCLSRWNVSRIALWSCETGLDPSFISLLSELTGATVLSASSRLSARADRLVQGGGSEVRLEEIFAEGAIQAWGGQLMAQQVFDAANSLLSFRSPTRQPLNGQDSTSAPYPVGTQFVFANVITIKGQQIDAVVSLRQTSGNASYVSGKSGEIDSETLQYATQAAKDYWQPWVTVSNNTQTPTPAFAKFSIDFILGNTYVPSTTTTAAVLGTQVTLQNVILNSYDIDGSGEYASARQYVELDQIGSFTLTDTSSLSVSTTASGGMCFKSTINGDVTAEPGSIAGDNVRFQVKYSELSCLGITFGDAGLVGSPGRRNTTVEATYTAFYAVDFGTGQAYSGGTPPPEYGIKFDLANNCALVNECGRSLDVKVYLTGSSANLPSGDVLVSISGIDPNEFAVSSSDFNADGKLVFTAADINNPDRFKTIRITGIDDNAFDGNTLTNVRFKTSAAITSGAPSSNDRYNNLTSFLKVVNLDNDTSISDVAAFECDSAAIFTVVAAANRTLNFEVQDISTTGMARAPIWVSANGGTSYQLITGSYVVPGSTGGITLKVRVGLSPEQSVLGEGVETFKLIVTSPDVSCPREATGSIVSLASLGDRVWHDANANGLQDAGEAGIAGAPIVLLNGSGQPALDGSGNAISTNSDGAGSYNFDCLIPGTYSVQFVKPEGFDAVSAPNQGRDESLDSNADPANGRSGSVSLLPGGFNSSIDAGFYKYANLSGKVYDDANNNGLAENGEAGIASVTLILSGFDGAGRQVSRTTTTSADGTYSFANLVPGTYTVSELQPLGYADGKDSVGSNGGNLGPDQISGITLASGASASGYNFGEIQPNSIGDRLWLDRNGDGIQNDSETGLAGRSVTLLGGGADGLLGTGDDTSSSTITDSNGNYSFDQLAPGQYQVVFGDVPNGSVFTIRDAGSDDTLDSDADPSGRSQVINLVQGLPYDTVDAGVYLTASLGDRVWIDSNGNGLQDDGEQGLANVIVYLTDSNGQRLLDGSGNAISTSTDGNGRYNFTGLRPDTYGIEVAKPTGYTFTASNRGSNKTIDSDVDTSNGKSGSITLLSGDSNNTVDAGIYKPSSLSGKVYVDANNNGSFDSGETPIAGVSLSLSGIDGTGNPVTLTASTNANGDYSFANLQPGVYTLVETQPSGFLDGKDSLGTAGGTLANDQVTSITLTSGTDATAYNFGEFNPASIGDRLWLDTNGDGIQNDGATGLVGRTVTLLGGGADGLLSTTADNTSTTTTTGADGVYAFNNLTPGQFRVVFSDIPTGNVFTVADAGSDDSKDSDVNAAGQSPIINLANGQTNNTVDAGIYKPVSIGNFVWEDINGDGIQNGSEGLLGGLGGVTVYLIDAAGNRISQGGIAISTITAADGSYSFNGLRPGSYGIEVQRPTGYLFSAKAQGGDDNFDSDVNSNGKAAAVTLLSGESSVNLDAGLFRPASLGDTIWHDLNANGIQEAGEPGVAGVTVYLLDGNGTRIRQSPTGAEVFQVTDANGKYNFSGLTPGFYGIEVLKPSGYAAFSSAAEGSDSTLDSDLIPNSLNPNSAKSDVGELSSGEIETSLDGGLYKLASLGDRVWGDTNANGIQDAGEVGTAGLTVELYDPTGSTLIKSTTTNASGLYSFTDLTPGDYVVKFSKPADAYFSDLGNGTSSTDSDAGADGFTNVITLVSGENNTSIDAGWNKLGSIGDFMWLDTNANGVQDQGELGFGGVQVQLFDEKGTSLLATTSTANDGSYSFTGLRAAKYIVAFSKPANYVFSDRNIGGASGDGTDSDADTTTGRTGVITVSSGQAVTNVDAGLYQYGAIGDRIWNDVNSNGIQDAGEAGLANVTVGLYKADGTSLLSTTSSNASGNYSFTNLRPGDYVVKVTKPSNFVVSPKGSTASNGTDSNIDSTGKTDLITIGSGEQNITIDAGFYQGTSASSSDLQISKTDGLTSVVAGQRVTYTIVVKNVGATAVANALVSDVMPNNLSNVSWTSKVDYGTVSGNDASGTGSINDTITSLGSNSCVTYTVSATVVKPGSNLSSSATSFDFKATADSAKSGIAANSRSFSSGDVTITARAFSREALSCGSVNWSTAYLGSYTTGLGVTNSAETTTEYRLDNVGNRRDYLLLQFSESVLIDKAYLRAALTDSDATFWIGSSGALTSLSDTVLSGLGTAEQNSGSNADRVADINAANKLGNTLVISAANNETSGNDNFTLAGLDVLRLLSSGSTISNTASVSGPSGFTDPNPANNSATDINSILTASGTRTPGFWVNKTWQTFWDGRAGNEPSQTGTAGFASGDLLFAPYQTGQQGSVRDPVTGSNVAGVLAGDWNRNGITDNGEQTIFYSTSEALRILDSSQQPDKGDVRYTLARSLVASWLNYMAGNPVDTASSTDKDARVWINQGITWLQTFTPDENKDGKGDGMLSKLSSSVSSPYMKANNANWTNASSGGSLINSNLDAYNKGSSLLADGNVYGGL